jgi:hypothetical protein
MAGTIRSKEAQIILLSYFLYVKPQYELHCRLSYISLFSIKV